MYVVSYKIALKKQMSNVFSCFFTILYDITLKNTKNHEKKQKTVSCKIMSTAPQLELTDQHRKVIKSCIVKSGYPSALARETGLARAIFQGWDAPGRKMSFGTWIAIVKYARRSGVVGPYFDPITLQEPPSNYDLDKEVSEAAWMLQRIPLDERSRIVTEIAAAYGKAVARERDGGAKLA